MNKKECQAKPVRTFISIFIRGLYNFISGLIECQTPSEKDVVCLNLLLVRLIHNNFIMGIKNASRLSMSI